ncbi:unnamed protein product [Caenorhabditis brenneri]
MRPLLFLFLLSTMCFGIIVMDSPLNTAKWFQKILDSKVLARDRDGVKTLTRKEFTFQDCKGKVLKRYEFADMAISTNMAGTVLEARADKLHVIYIVQYGKRKMQFMITEAQVPVVAWGLARGQDLIC